MEVAVMNVIELIGYTWALCTTGVLVLIYFVFPEIYNKHKDDIL